MSHALNILKNGMTNMASFILGVTMCQDRHHASNDQQQRIAQCSKMGVEVDRTVDTYQEGDGVTFWAVTALFIGTQASLVIAVCLLSSTLSLFV